MDPQDYEWLDVTQEILGITSCNSPINSRNEAPLGDQGLRIYPGRMHAGTVNQR